MADDDSSHDSSTEQASRDGRDCTDNQPREFTDDRAADDPAAGTTVPSEGQPSNTYGHPLPWLALDYDYFETDDRHPSLDANAPTVDEDLVGQTGFDPSDGDTPAYWEWLKELNNGRGESSRRGQLSKAGMERDTDIIADRLGATEYQTQRAKYLLDQIDIKKQLIPDGPIEQAILGVLSVVIDEARTRYARRTANQMTEASIPVSSVLRDDAFEDLCADFDLARSRIRDVRHRLRQTEEYDSPS